MRNYTARKSKRTQINYINNRHSLINIEQLNTETSNAFWFGLLVGGVGGLFTACYLLNKKAESEKK